MQRADKQGLAEGKVFWRDTGGRD